MVEMTDNPCTHCKHKCCIDIVDKNDLAIPYPSQDQIDQNSNYFLRKHPLFYIIGDQEVQSTPTTYIHHYSCTNFDKKTQSCLDHPNRYDMCKDTGITYKPANRCDLWEQTHPYKRNILSRLFNL